SRAARSSSASYTSSGRYVEIWRLPATLFCGIRVTSSERKIVFEFAVAPHAHAGVHAQRCHEPVDLVAPLVDPPGGVYLALHDPQDLGPHRLALLDTDTRLRGGLVQPRVHLGNLRRLDLLRPPYLLLAALECRHRASPPCTLIISRYDGTVNRVGKKFPAPSIRAGEKNVGRRGVFAVARPTDMRLLVKTPRSHTWATPRRTSR